MMIVPQVIYLAVGFLVIFTGISVFQTLLAAKFPDSGPILIAINYAAYAVGSYFAPRSSRKKLGNSGAIKRRIVWTAAAMTYPVWILCFVISDSVWFYYFASVLNGLGSGLLWAIQGIWFTDLCKDKFRKDHSGIAFWNGVFFSIYQLAPFIGNTVALISVYVSIDSNSNLLQYILASFSALGALMVFMMPTSWISPASIESGDVEQDISDNESEKGFLSRHKANVKELWTKTKFPFLVFLIIEYAMVNAFSWISIAVLIGSYSPQLALAGFPEDFLLLVTYTVYGFVSVLAYAFLGNVIDRFISSKKIIMMTYFTILLPLGICISLNIQEKLGINLLIASFCMIAGLLSIVVSVFTNVVTLSIAKGMINQNNSEAFVQYQTIYCIVYGLFSMAQVKLPVKVMAIIVISFAPLSLFLFYFFDRNVSNSHSVIELDNAKVISDE
jgi:MFS family permease